MSENEQYLGFSFQQEIGVDDSLKPTKHPFVKHTIRSATHSRPPNLTDKEIYDMCKHCNALRGNVSATQSKRSATQDKVPVEVYCSIGYTSTAMESKQPKYYSSSVHCNLREKMKKE